MDSAASQNAAPSLCAGGCGFWSNAGTEGLCSKCYRERAAEDQAAAARVAALSAAGAGDTTAELAAAEVVAPPTEPAQLDLASTSSPAADTAPVEAAAEPAVAPAAEVPAAAGDTPGVSGKVSTRCMCCRKKVGLLGFTCKCGQLFCGQHRYAEAHACTFDYQGSERARLAANNPTVQASKIQRI